MGNIRFVNDKPREGRGLSDFLEGCLRTETGDRETANKPLIVALLSCSALPYPRRRDVERCGEAP